MKNNRKKEEYSMADAIVTIKSLFDGEYKEEMRRLQQDYAIPNYVIEEDEEYEE